MAMLIVPDEMLRQAGLSEREALLEFACRLFDAGRLSLWSAIWAVWRSCWGSPRSGLRRTRSLFPASTRTPRKSQS